MKNKEKYNILLNGASAGSNFGDFLFAKMFQDFVSNNINGDVFWYDGIFTLSEFYKKHLNYNKKYKLRDIDALVYISGGYFCGKDTRFSDYVFRMLNYFVIGIRCIFRKKPIAIIGVEVGIPSCWWLRCIERFILRKSSVLIVRNKESLESLKHYGINNAICTADTVFAMDETLFANYKVPREIENEKNKKIFLHVNPYDFQNEQIKRKVVPVLNDFLHTHPEYVVIIGTDQYSAEQSKVMDSVRELIVGSKVYYNYYDDPIALCRLLNSVDCVITTKLHVGIVGARLGKSVISFSGHTEKIQRLYKQLNELERTMPLSDFDSERALKMMEKYHNIPIKVSNEIIEAAKDNFVRLKEFLCYWRND